MVLLTWRNWERAGQEPPDRSQEVSGGGRGEDGAFSYSCQDKLPAILSIFPCSTKDKACSVIRSLPAAAVVSKKKKKKTCRSDISSSIFLLNVHKEGIDASKYCGAILV